MAKRKKGESKFKPRSYRFSLRTQRLISKLAKRTEEDQNDVVRKALEGYEEHLNVELFEYNNSHKQEPEKKPTQGLPQPGTKEHTEGMLAGLEAMQIRNRIMGE